MKGPQEDLWEVLVFSRAFVIKKVTLYVKSHFSVSKSFCLGAKLLQCLQHFICRNKTRKHRGPTEDSGYIINCCVCVCVCCSSVSSLMSCYEGEILQRPEQCWFWPTLTLCVNFGWSEASWCYGVQIFTGKFKAHSLEHELCPAVTERPKQYIEDGKQNNITN